MRSKIRLVILDEQPNELRMTGPHWIRPLLRDTQGIVTSDFDVNWQVVDKIKELLQAGLRNVLVITSIREHFNEDTLKMFGLNPLDVDVLRIAVMKKKSGFIFVTGSDMFNSLIYGG